jgi:hypothetical protein
MKKFILFSAIATLFALSCDKKDSAPEAPSLIHKWNLVNAYYIEMDNGTVIDEDNYVGTTADYWEFKSDNKFYSLVGGQKDTVDYQLLPDNKVMIDGDTATIQELTMNSAKLYQKYSLSADTYFEYTINLKR